MGVFILTAYGVLVSGLTSSKITIMLADVISGLSVIGIAIMIYPLFKKTNKSLTNTYIVLKIIEGLLMVIGGFLILTNSTVFLKDWLYNNIHIYVFIVSAFIFYYLFLKSKLIPRYISIWGLAAIGFLFLKTLLNLFGINSQIIDIFLILVITNEVYLAIWLMIKGFNNKNNKEIS